LFARVQPPLHLLPACPSPTSSKSSSPGAGSSSSWFIAGTQLGCGKPNAIKRPQVITIDKWLVCLPSTNPQMVGSWHWVAYITQRSSGSSSFSRFMGPILRQTHAIHGISWGNYLSMYLSIHLYIYIYLEPSFDPSFGWLTFNFMGQNLENKGHLGSRYIYIYDGMPCIDTSGMDPINLDTSLRCFLKSCCVLEDPSSNMALGS
jgi:hypothetical protein